MQTRRLGKNGPSVSALGLGCMGMSEFYGPGDEAESIATMHRALALGCTFLDTADVYGPFTNEELVGRAIRAQGEDIVPIPGTKRRKYLEENLASLSVELTPADLARIAAIAPTSAIAGERYPEAMMRYVNA